MTDRDGEAGRRGDGARNSKSLDRPSTHSQLLPISRSDLTVFPSPRFLLLTSLQRNGTWSLANYRDLLSQTIVFESIFTSIAVSLLTVLLCAAIGIPLAFLFERYAFPCRRLFAMLAAL